MATTIKITKGQPFVLWIPTIILNADSKVPVDSSTLSNVGVHVSSVCNGVDITPSVNYCEHWIVLGFDAGLIVGPYRVEVTGNLASGRSFRLRMAKPFEIVQWDHESNWRDYLVGDHIELSDQPFIAGEFTTDAEYEELKRQLHEQIAAAEQAEEEAIAEKERYAEALEHLDDVAKQGSNPLATNTAILEAFGNIDFSTLAKEQTMTTGIQTMLSAINPKATTEQLTNATTAIMEAISHISPEDPNSKALAEFFGITAATQYTALTDAEVIACCRDEQYNVMGDEWPIPAWLPDGLTEQDIQTAATALGITYHAPTETPSES